MNILLLSPYPEKIVNTIRATDSVLATADVVSLDFLEQKKIDFVVSYGYRHIIKEPILSSYHHRIINLHIAYLPWNRGANPNFWSWYEQTPNGVSIHYVDAGIDTGPILIQEQINLSLEHTLDSSNAALKEHIQDLFVENWRKLRSGSIAFQIQTSRGTFHSSKNTSDALRHFPLGGNTPVTTVMELGQKLKLQE